MDFVPLAAEVAMTGIVMVMTPPTLRAALAANKLLTATVAAPVYNVFFVAVVPVPVTVTVCPPVAEMMNPDWSWSLSWKAGTAIVPVLAYCSVYVSVSPGVIEPLLSISVVSLTDL